MPRLACYRASMTVSRRYRSDGAGGRPRSTGTYCRALGWLYVRRTDELIFRDATEARRTVRLLLLVALLLAGAALCFSVLPYPYSDYLWMILAFTAGFGWAYLALQLRVGRSQRDARKVDGALLRKRVVLEAAQFTSADPIRWMARRRFVLWLLALSSALALLKLLWRALR
jgi:hypothetical protein